MHLTSVECCARGLRAAALVCLAWCALSLICSTDSHATFYHYGSPSVYIEVVDKDGPIRVYDDFVRHGEGGLPSLNLFEKYKPSDDPNGYWSAVEVEVSVRVEDSWGHGHHSYSHWFDWWCDDEDGWGDDWEDDDPAGPGSVYIGIDKFVKNKTGDDWSNFRIELGTGIGDDYTASDDDDGLYFTSDPMNKEVTSNYDPTPIQTDDSLMWVSDGTNYPGQEDGDKSIFWFGVHVPQELFELESGGGGWGHWGHHGAEYWKARFTIYQHVDVPIDPMDIVPEPATAMLMLLGSLSCGLVRNRKV